LNVEIRCNKHVHDLINNLPDTGGERPSAAQELHLHVYLRSIIDHVLLIHALSLKIKYIQ
jgi:hypothetical protein